MSENSDHYQLTTPPPSTLSSPNNQNNKRISLQQQFLPSPSDLNTTLSTTQNDSSSPQSYTSPTVNDVCAGSHNGVRNASTTMKTSPNGNHCNDKYAFTLEFSSPVVKTKKDPNRNKESQLFPFDMAANDEEDLHSPFELDVPLCENQSLKKIQNDFLIDRMFKDDMNSNFTSSQQQRSPNQSSYTNVLNHTSPLLTPSSDHHDIDALSDAGTYIIEDDIDIARDDEPEQDLEQQKDTPEQKPSSPFKRYTKTRKNRQGTFDIHAVLSPSTTTTAAPHAVNRPIVDLNIPTHDLSSSSSSSSANLSSSSSLLSLPTESDNSTRKEPEGASHYIINDKSSTGIIYARQRPNSLSEQQKQQQPRSITPPQNQIKQSECFVISPTFETKSFPNLTNAALRRKIDSQYKSKPTTSVIPTKDTNFEIPSKKLPPSPPLSTRSNQSDTERYSFRLQQSRPHESKQPPPPPPPQPLSNHRSTLHNSDYNPSSLKSSVRPHTSSNDQTYSSPFQRNTTIRQTMPANTQYNRPLSSSTTNKYLDDNEEILSTHPSLTKVYMNKSFALRRQRSNLVPSTSKHVQQQPPPPSSQQAISKALQARQLLKPTTTTTIPSTSLSTSSSSGQTNRAVELRRARAQAKIEELAQRTRQQLQKTEQHNDIMSASWHSNASSSSKKDFSNLRANPRSNNNNNTHHHQQHLSSQKQDMLKTRTIPSSSSHQRSSSVSPNPLGEPTARTSKYRKQMTSSVTDESQYQRMNGSTYSEGDRCDSLRDDGQRLAIKLIQLSSGILAKLKPTSIAPDNDSNVRELEQLVDQLQTVNRTLSSIDASLNDPTSDESLP